MFVFRVISILTLRQSNGIGKNTINFASFKLKILEVRKESLKYQTYELWLVRNNVFFIFIDGEIFFLSET